MKILEEQVALVTGASRGIGKAVALELARNGASVAVNYSGSREGAEKTASEIAALGVKALVWHCDVSKAEEVQGMIQGVMDKFGHIDILVNNAGIIRDGFFARMKEEAWDAVINTNLKGVFLVTKAALRPMMAQKKGKIINVASVVGILGNIGQANYSAAKAGVIGLTKTAAREVAAFGINVNAVAPGFIETDMTRKLSDKIKEKMEEQIPLGREGSPQDVAKVVRFLASPDSDYLTGQTLSVDGGMVMQ